MKKEDRGAALLCFALYLGSGFVVGATARTSSWWANGFFVVALLVLVLCGMATLGFILDAGKKE